MSTTAPAHFAAEIAECLGDTSTQWGASRFVEWHRCRKAHDLRHVQGIVPLGERPEYFGIGTLVHAGINFLQRGVMAREAQPRDWRLVLEAAATTMPPEVCDEAYRLLDAYFAHYGDENAGWPEGSEILGAELHLQDTEAFALPYTARADTVLRLASGEIVIPDTKTRRSAIPEERAEFARGMAVRPQFTGLSWLVQGHLHLEEPPHIWVNAIIKTKIPKFDRLLVKMTPEGVSRWVTDHALEALAMRRGGSPLANRSQCAPELGRKCDYFDHCHGSPEVRAHKFTTKETTP